MHTDFCRARVALLAASILCLIGGLREGAAQPAAAQPAPAPTAKSTQPFDLSGYWVPVITEDWRWRMTTPPKGDIASVPLNREGRRAAGQWDLARDNAAGNECRAFGAAGLLRQPARVHITWQDDHTLRLETDAGQQTRLFHFDATPPPGEERSWQGFSVAKWRKQAQARGASGYTPPTLEGGSLQVETTWLKAGYLRKNGVPYSESAALTEYFDVHTGPGDLIWFTVTTIVDDPIYLMMPFITSTSFKREPDGSKWRPTPCQTDPPRPRADGGE